MKKALSLAFTLVITLLCLMGSMGTMGSVAIAADDGKVLIPSEQWETWSRRFQQEPNHNDRIRFSGDNIGYAQMGDAVTIPDVDFGTEGYRSIALEMKNDLSSGAVIQVVIGSLYGDVVAEVAVTQTGDEKKTFTADFNRKITGVHDVTLRYGFGYGSLFKVTLSDTPDSQLPVLSDVDPIMLVPIKGNTDNWETTPSGDNPEFGLKDNSGEYYTYHENGMNLGYTGPGCKVKIKGVDFGIEGINSISLAVGVDNTSDLGFKVTAYDGDTALQTTTVTVKGSNDWNISNMGTGFFDEVVTGVKDIEIEWLNNGNMYGIALGKSQEAEPIEPTDPNKPFIDGDGNLVVPAGIGWTLTPGAHRGKELKYVPDEGCIGYNKDKNVITTPVLNFDGNVYKTIEIEYAYPPEDGANGKADILLGGTFGAYLCTIDIPASSSYSDKVTATVDLPVKLPEGSQLSFFFHGTAGTTANVFSVKLKDDGTALPAASKDQIVRAVYKASEDWETEDAGTNERDPEYTADHEYYILSPYYGWMADGDTLTIPQVDFGTKGFAGIELYMANDGAPTDNCGQIEILIEDKLVATVDVKGTRDFWTFRANEAEFAYKVTGKHNVNLVFNDCSSNLSAVVLRGEADAGLPEYTEAGGSEKQPKEITVEEVTVQLLDGDGNPLKNVRFTLNGLVSKDGKTGKMEETKSDFLDGDYTTDNKGKTRVMMVRGEEYVLTFQSDLSGYGLDSNAVLTMSFPADGSDTLFVYDVKAGEFLSSGSDEGTGPATGLAFPLAVFALIPASGAVLAMARKRQKNGK